MKPIPSNTILRDAVIKELDDDPEVAAEHISVTAIDGAVSLAGHVMTVHEKHVAVRAAERVDAVRAVADDIEVREPSLHERADDEIAEEIAHLQSWPAEIPDSVGVQVREGRVILHGDVESVSQRDTAESAVRQLPGVRAVANLIRIKVQTEPTAPNDARREQTAEVGRQREYGERSMDVGRALDYFQRKTAFTTGPVELSRAIENSEVNVVDVRLEGDYRAGHIPGAINLPQDRWQTFDGVVKDRPNVLVCYSHVCHLAAHAAVEFAQAGYPVIELDGGWKEWQRHNLATEQEPS